MIEILYNVEHQEAAGLLIAIYFYLTGISAGSFILSTLAYVFGQVKFKPIGKISVILATVVLIIAPMALLIHVEDPYGPGDCFTISTLPPLSLGVHSYSPFIPSTVSSMDILSLRTMPE